MEFAASKRRRWNFQSWTKIAQFSPPPACSVHACVEDHKEIFASLVTGSQCFQPDSRPLRRNHIAYKVGGRGYVSVLQSRMSYLRDYFWYSEKSQLKLYLLEFSFIVFWFAFLICKPEKLMEMEAISCQCPVYFLPKRNSRFYFCRHRFFHILLDVCFASSSNRFSIADG